MSTPGTPGRPSRPAAGWYPKLENQGLPRALTNGMQQSFSLVYSLRDTVDQLQQTFTRLVQYGTHLNRGLTQAQSVPDAAFWFETDRETVFYQARLAPPSTTRDWFYAGGIYAATFVNRPTDLGPNDLGFLFLPIDKNNVFYRWNGTSWDTV